MMSRDCQTNFYADSDSIKILQDNLPCKLIKINLDKIQNFDNYYLCRRVHVDL